MALSHCWGPGQRVPKTLKSTLEDHRKQISVTSLTKTFKDAIQITRRLNIRYLWIDSLCIVQDDPADFFRECSRMYMIYSRALCTIAAMDSEDGDGGCFIPRDPYQVKPCEISFEDGPSDYRILRISPNFGSWLDAVSGPLGSRGWALQEHQLSPRVLIYTKKRLLWECRTHRASEDRPRMETKYGVGRVTQLRRRLLDHNPVALRPSEIKKELLDRWYDLVDDYSRRDLTHYTDKLPAFSGIAAVVGKLRPKDTYLAGLWRNDIIRGLSWFLDVQPTDQKFLTAYHRRQSNYKPQPDSTWPPPLLDDAIPSWSWAAFNGPIMHYGKDWSRDWSDNMLPHSGSSLKLVEAKTTLEGPDIFGRVKCGEIRLSNYSTMITVSEENHRRAKLGRWKKPWHRKMYSMGDEYLYSDRAVLYFDVDPYNLPKTQLLCLQIGTGTSISNQAYPPYSVMHVGLVLTAVREDVYRRVGMFEIKSDSIIWCYCREIREVCIV